MTNVLSIASGLVIGVMLLLAGEQLNPTSSGAAHALTLTSVDVVGTLNRLQLAGRVGYLGAINPLNPSGLFPQMVLGLLGAVVIFYLARTRGDLEGADGQARPE